MVIIFNLKIIVVINKLYKTFKIYNSSKILELIANYNLGK